MAVHNTLTGTELHEVKGAAAATKSFALIADGAGSSAFLALLGTNTVIVRQLSDLPAASGGKITLAANTSYRFGADVNIGADFLEFGAGTDIMAAGAFTTTVTYTGSGSMCVGVDVNATIRDITLSCASAQALDFSETTGNTKIVIISDVLITACLTTGTFDKIRTTVVDGMTVLNCTDGLVFAGAASTSVRLVSVALISTSTSYVGIDFTGSTQKTINIDGVILVGGAGSIGLKGDAANANVTTGFIANVSNVQFGGVTTPLSGITVDDFRWNFQGNGVVSDSMPDALLSFTSNATVTTLSVGVPTLVAGTFTLDRASHFTTTTAGRATYDGERDLVTPIDVSVVIDPASGTNKTFRVFVAINGVAIVNSGIAVNISSGDPKQISVPWQAKLSTTDFVEIFIENETDSVDATVIDATVRLR